MIHNKFQVDLKVDLKSWLSVKTVTYTQSNVLEYSRISIRQSRGPWPLYYTIMSSRPHLVCNTYCVRVTKFGHVTTLLHKMSSRPHHVRDKYTQNFILLHKTVENRTDSTDLVTKISGFWPKPHRRFWKYIFPK